MASEGLQSDRLTYKYRDGGVEPGGIYKYRVEVVAEQGQSILFETEVINVPKAALTLYQNHPNPFNPTTTIGYYLPGRCHVSLEIFDVAGRLVAQLINHEQSMGQHSFEWGGHDTRGNIVSTGTYFCRLEAGKKTISKKMIILR